MFRIELLSLAEDELSEAYEWYEEQQATLGNRFYKEINHYLSLIEINPYLFPVKYIEELRQVPVNKFPYVIIYWVDELTRTVYIVSIFHTSKNPRF